MRLAKAIAALVLGAIITTSGTINASAANAGVAQRFETRYVLSGTVVSHHVFGDINKTWCTIVDDNGEEWVYAYDCYAVMPPVGMRVCMIMDNNETAQDITDDSIEDLLWCDCDYDD